MAFDGEFSSARSNDVRELDASEIEQVTGGVLVPLLVLGAIVITGVALYAIYKKGEQDGYENNRDQ